MEKDIRAEVDEAAKQAEDDPFPELEQAFQNIFWKENFPVRGVEFTKSYKP